jgi:dipeptidyl aminopeptidase/acylaminoacyl peptidase
MRRSTGRSRRRDAMVRIAACIAPHENGRFRTSIAKTDDPSRVSPVLQVRAGAPPVLLVHATGDEYCDYEPVPSFTQEMESADNEMDLLTRPAVSHFFLFRSPPGRASGG